MISGQEAPFDTSLTKATTMPPGQLSVSSVIMLISGAGTSSMHSTVAAAGLEAVGGVVSSTFMTCEAVAVFPQASVAVHVRVTEYSLAHVPGVDTSLNVSTGVPQLSVAVGVVHVGLVVHSMVDGPGNGEIVGGVVSSTLITWVAVLVLPQTSVAVQMRVMEYSFAHEPGVVASANANVGVPQLSVAVGVAHTGEAEHSIVEGPGNGDITGGVVSSTFIVCEAVDVFPHASVAVHVRTIVNSFAHDPGVVASAKVNTGVPQLSVAVGVAHEGVPVHSIVVGPGNGEMTGGVVSSTLITWDAVAVFPHTSVAVHVRETEYSFAHEPGVVTSANDKVGVPQLSVAVGVAHTGVTEHSVVVGPGNGEMTGGVVSTTLIICAAVEVFPQGSVAVHVRVMVYSFAQVPGVVTSTNASAGVPQLSVAVGVAHVGVTAHSVVVTPGSGEITGGVVSSTFMVWAAVLVLPQASVAVHVRETVYSFAHDPGVVTSAKLSVGVEQLSVAVGVAHTGTTAHSTVDGAGRADMTGGVVSSAFIV